MLEGARDPRVTTLSTTEPYLLWRNEECWEAGPRSWLHLDQRRGDLSWQQPLTACLRVSRQAMPALCRDVARPLQLDRMGRCYQNLERMLTPIPDVAILDVLRARISAAPSRLTCSCGDHIAALEAINAPQRGELKLREHLTASCRRTPIPLRSPTRRLL